MAVRLDTCVSAVARDVGLDPDRNSQDKQNIIGWINDARREIYELPIQFSALEIFGEFTGVTVVTAGTVKATQNQAEVTGSSTSFTTAMGGRYIKIGTAVWKRIAFVTDTTHLTLESSWVTDTVTGQSYKIWKRDYQMPPAIAKITRIIPLDRPDDQVAYFDPSEFTQRYGFGDSFGEPIAFTQFGTSDLADAYLASTVYASVSVTAKSPIVDFAAAAGIVTGLAVGDRIKIGNSTTSTAFTVDRILTDAKAAIRGYVAQTGSSLSATAISLDRLNVRVWQAIDDSKTYYWEGNRKQHDLVADDDWLEEGWYTVIKKSAVAKAFDFVNDPRASRKLLEAQDEIRNLVRTQFKAHNPAPRLKPYIPSRYGYTGRAFPSDRDLG